MNFRKLIWSVLFLFATAIFISSCSQVRYTYYKKHNIPYNPPGEPKLAKAIPSKPFLMQTETAVRQSQARSNEKISAKNPGTQKAAKAGDKNHPEQKKVVNDFDIVKYFQEHHAIITAKDNVTIDNRTLMIVLLVVLILVLLSLIPGALWLLWVALLVLLILVLVKYLGLFG